MVGSRRRSGGRTGLGGRVRLGLGLLSGALAVALCAVLVDRYVLRAEWWQVRHTVTAEPIAPQSEVGPPPGPLATTWERATEMHHGPVAGYDSVAYDVAQGQVVTVSGRGLDVRDARTGADRWSYRRSGWTLLGWASTRSRLVAYFERDGRRGDRLLVGFDALSGGLLWRREGERPAAVARTTLRWPAGSAVVLTTDGARRELTGRSAEDGSPMWSRRLPDGCRLFEGAAHPSDAQETLAALALDCPGRSRLLAVDPLTGRIRWNRPLGSDESPEVSMLDGVTLAWDGKALRAFGQDGAQFAVWEGDGVCGDVMCPSVLASGRLVVAYHPEGTKPGGARLEAVEVPSGQVAWRRDVPDYAALAQAGGRIYALRPRLSELLLPAGVDLVAAADGATTTAPAPVTLDADLPGVRPWMAAAGGLLYVAAAEAPPRPEGSGRLVALRGGAAGTGPAELGGVPESGWPDACALLTKDDLATAHMDAYVTEPTRASVGGVRLPHPVSCTYEPRDDRKKGSKKRADDERRGDPSGEGRAGASPSATVAPGPSTAVPSLEAPATDEPETGEPGMGDLGMDDPETDGPGTDRPEAAEPEPVVRGLTVSVRWVADDPGTASRLLDGMQATQAQVRRRRDIGGDEAYEFGPTAGTIALRVGRVIVVVDADRPPGAAARIAHSVARRLQQLS
ncbi:outer membrane protein assembly factor BamB family protein [Actinomadura fibrosa]|uniref:PQQ-binding-like beta-propeller repeat protein n=1 Tax=Actinomadura fibrosa TaxID=111802 RepID=A0ABW2XLL1_9ACTN|nr:PQQ-binding-like beta-propeller repeat protein [Actinomadura fibrosa]